MLLYEECLAPARPREVLALLKQEAAKRGWAAVEEHPDRFFRLEEAVSRRQEPRKLVVSVEKHPLGTAVRLAAWCSGFSVRRLDDKVDLIPALPYECTRPTGEEARSQDTRTGAEAAGGRSPLWVVRARLAEFGLLFLSFAAVALWAVAVIRDMSFWYGVVGVVVAAVASVSSGVVLDLLVRRALGVVSRDGIGAQLRRSGPVAVVAVILLVWVSRM